MCEAINLPLSSPRRRGPIRRVIALWYGRQRSKIQWLWVPAFAGTTVDSSVPTLSDQSTGGRSTTAHASTTTMLLSPLEKLKEQGFPLLVAGAPSGACAVQERLEILASSCLAANKLGQLL